MVQEKNAPNKERRSKKSGAPTPASRAATTHRHNSLRQTLIQTAESLIATAGLPALRARTLADAANCSVGAIYNIFPDLDALILEVNALTLKAISRHLSTSPPTTETPAQKFAALAAAYLTYAVSNRPRWDALFTHRLPTAFQVPDSFLATQATAFSHIEAPLHQLRPDIDPNTLTLLSRTIFSAVHGAVSFGLDHRTGPIDLPTLKSQLATLATAIATGLATKD